MIKYDANDMKTIMRKSPRDLISLRKFWIESLIYSSPIYLTRLIVEFP